jgi:hypothetical protein
VAVSTNGGRGGTWRSAGRSGGILWRRKGVSGPSTERVLAMNGWIDRF